MISIRDLDITIDEQVLKFELWDTAEGEEYDQLRPISYANTNIFLLCFAIDWPETLESIEQKYVPELLHFCSHPSVPYLLVGCKSDLRPKCRTTESRQGNTEIFVSREEAEVSARRIGAFMYVECSARTGYGVQEVLRKAAFAASLRTQSRRRHEECLIL